MRVALKAAMAMLVLLTMARPVCAQIAAAQQPVFQMEYSHPEITPSHWILTLHPDGSGHFRSERESGSAVKTRVLEAPNVDRDIRLSEGFAAHVFAVARQRNWFKMECESSSKVAFMGWKKFSYNGSEGQGACQFNFSTDKQIQELGASLMAVAETIIEGARLEMLLQHDRLGLDKAIEGLTEEVGAGRAQQLCLIRGVLERLAEDPGVMERVRKRARVLLVKAGE